MKNWATILLLFSSTFLFAQNEISYGDVLKKTREINITDSVLLDVGSMEHNILDTITLKTFFPSLYPPLVTKKSRPVEYYISGKITTHPYFDVLFVTTKKETDDNHLFQSVYLMTTRKDGSNISTLAVAIKRENDAVVNTNSCTRITKFLSLQEYIQKEKILAG